MRGRIFKGDQKGMFFLIQRVVGIRILPPAVKMESLRDILTDAVVKQARHRMISGCIRGRQSSQKQAPQNSGGIVAQR